MNINEYLSLAEALTTVCTSVQLALLKDIREKGEASLILTGGQTVQPFLQGLTKIDVPWEKVWVVLSDERWVPVTDDISNEKQLRELFLSRLKKQPRYISLKTAHSTPEEALSVVISNISQVQHPFSCSLLSMGEDGHVASLFPGENWEGSCLAIQKPDAARTSLGIQHFCKANQNIILVPESRKRVVKDIEDGKVDSPIKLIWGNSTIVTWNSKIEHEA